MRLVFAGTPGAAVPSLRRLAASDHDVVAVVTRLDAPVGRKRVLTPSPVAAVAAELGIDTIKAARLDAAATAQITAVDAELGVIVAYGGLVREPLLSAPAHGWINLHFSLLPRWRGAAPVQRAIIAGDAVTGVSVFQLVPALDAGDVYGERPYSIPDDATAGDALDTIAEQGAELLHSVVDAIAEGTAVPTPQTGEPTLAPKLTLDDGRIRWDEARASVLARVHGTTPEPGAHTTIEGSRLKVLAASMAAGGAERLPPGQVALHERAVVVGTGDDPVVLLTVQPAGKGAMSAADWWRGLRDTHPRLGS